MAWLVELINYSTITEPHAQIYGGKFAGNQSRACHQKSDKKSLDFPGLSAYLFACIKLNAVEISCYQ